MPPFKPLDLKELVEQGYLQEVNRLFFHPLGLALTVTEYPDRPAVLWIQDWREDLEGMTFDDDALLPELADNIGNQWAARSWARVRKLGFMVQPVQAQGALTTRGEVGF